MARRTLMIPKVMLKAATVRQVKLPDLSMMDRRRPAPKKVVFSVAGRPVPWKVSRRGTKNPALVAWQEWIGHQAHMAMAGRRPMEGPVRLRMAFRLNVRPGRVPDLRNLCKAAEDALNGICFVDDTQVCRDGNGRDIVAGWQGVSIIVESLGG